MDLASIYTIDQVVLNWEAAYGKGYEIQVSADALSWVTVYTESNGDGGIDDISFAPASARYVRMLGVQRGTDMGLFAVGDRGLRVGRWTVRQVDLQRVRVPLTR